MVLFVVRPCKLIWQLPCGIVNMRTMVLFYSEDLYTYLPANLWDSKNRHPFIMTEVRTMDPDIIAFQVPITRGIISSNLDRSQIGSLRFLFHFPMTSSRLSSVLILYRKSDRIFMIHCSIQTCRRWDMMAGSWWMSRLGPGLGRQLSGRRWVRRTPISSTDGCTKIVWSDLFKSRTSKFYWFFLFCISGQVQVVTQWGSPFPWPCRSLHWGNDVLLQDYVYVYVCVCVCVCVSVCH